MILRVWGSRPRFGHIVCNRSQSISLLFIGGLSSNHSSFSVMSLEKKEEEDFTFGFS